MLLLLEPECAHQHIDVRAFLDPQLRVQGVRVQIQQVLITFVENAIDAMAGVSQRRRELRIRSECRALRGHRQGGGAPTIA